MVTTENVSPLRALASGVLLLGLLFGAPLLLLAFAGNPLPEAVPSLSKVVRALSTPDDGTLFLTIIVWVAWVAWAAFTVSVLVEIPAQLSGRRAPKLPGLGGFQGGARWLVAPILAAASLTGTAANAADTAPAATTSVSAEETTQAGDTLWGLAETHLGDGSRWTEIYELNRDTVGPDPNQLLQGEQLTMPDTRSSTPAPASSTTSHAGAHRSASDRSATGDQGHGSPVKHEETKDKATQSPAADREQTPTKDTPAKEVEAPAADETPAAPVPAAPSAPSRTVTPEQSDAHDQQSTEDTDAEDSITAPSTLGLGAASAAGVLTLLAGARAMQRRRRRPGQRIAMPEQDEGAAQVEEDLTNDADPLAAADIDRALRTLAWATSKAGQSLPGMRGARLAEDHLEIFLSDDTLTLPAPFESITDAPGVFVVPREGLDGLLDEQTAQTVPSPYPALVTLGSDDDGGWVMLNLEEIESLGLVGPATECRAVLAAAALELISSTWADDLRVTLVGDLRELSVALSHDRVDYAATVSEVIAPARYAAAVHSKALARAGVQDVTTARGAGLVDSTWTPHLFLLGTEPTEEERAQLAELVNATPRVAVATITTHTKPLSPWVLELGEDAQAVLHPVEATLMAQRVHPAQYNDLIDLMQITQSSGSSGPEWTTTLTDATQPIPTVPVAEVTQLHQSTDPADPGQAPAVEDEAPQDEQEVTTDPTEAPQPSEASAAATVLSFNSTPPPAPETEETEETEADTPDDEPEDQDDLAATGEDTPGGDTTEASEETSEDQTGDLVPFTPRGPVLRLLGPVTLEGTQGKAPSAPGRITELIAALALRPADTSEELDAALWPAKAPAASTRNVAMSKARSWLGTAEDGTPLVPLVDQGGYRLADGVTVDWHQMLELVGQDISRATTAELTQALSLVTGPPISGVNPKKYAWAATIREEMIATISDIAHELATRHTRAGRSIKALDATAIGLTADGTNEALWRARLRAAAAAGALDSCTEEMTQALDAVDGDLEPETIVLLEELHDPTHQAQA